MVSDSIMDISNHFEVSIWEYVKEIESNTVTADFTNK